MYSGVVAYNGTEPQSAVAQYNGYAVFDGGLQVTYGGFAIGGHVDYGQFDTNYLTQPKGGRDELAWLVGTSYQFGSAIVGVSYFNAQGPGQWNSTNQAATGRTLNQSGVAAGGTLALAPGAWIFLTYLYGDKHQFGVDEVTGTAPAAGSTYSAAYLTHNNTQAQALLLGTRLSW